MVHKNLLRGLFFLAFISTFAKAKDKVAEEFIVGKAKKTPNVLKGQLFAFAPNAGANLNAASPTPAVATQWVSRVTTYNVSETDLKALGFYIQSTASSSPVSEKYFAIIKEQSVERNKNADGEREEGANYARIILTVVRLISSSQYIGGNKVISIKTLDFNTSAKTPIKIEIRNDNALSISKWNEAGNYFFRQTSNSDLPAFELRNLLPYKEETGTPQSSKQLQSEFLTPDP